MKISKKLGMSIFVISAIIGVQCCTFFTFDKVNYATEEYVLNYPTNLKMSNGIDVRLEWNQTGLLGNTQYYNRKILAKDSEDNIYMVVTYNEASMNRGLLRKYDKEGTLQWSRVYSEFQYGLTLPAVNVDSSGNIYVAGTTLPEPSSDSDVILLKYNSSGDLQWEVNWGSDDNERGNAIAFDSMDNVYVAGSAYHSPITLNSMFYAKFNSSGHYQMNKTITGTTDVNNGNKGNDIAIDQFDNIYLGGRFLHNASLFKFDVSGTYHWNVTYNYDSIALSNEALAVEVDSSGIFVGSRIHPYYYIIKYDTMGNELWNDKFSDEIHDLKLDSTGDIYVVGDKLIKYNSSGVHQWSWSLSNDGLSVGRGLVLDSSDDVYVAGGYATNDMFIAKYSSKPEIAIHEPLEEEIYGKIAPHYNLSIFEPDLDEIWCNLGAGNFPITTLSGQLNQEEWDKVGGGGNIIIDIRFYANDTFGNQCFAEVSVYKDTSGPNIDIISPTSGSEFGETSPSFEIEIWELQTKFVKAWYTIDNGATNISLTSEPYSNTYESFEGYIDDNEWSKASDGQITLRVYAEDTVGNVHFEEVSFNKDANTGGSIPLEMIIIITSAIGGIAVIGVIIVVLRRRNSS